jgi:hypothetical protein
MPSPLRRCRLYRGQRGRAIAVGGPVNDPSAADLRALTCARVRYSCSSRLSRRDQGLTLVPNAHPYTDPMETPSLRAGQI